MYLVLANLYLGAFYGFYYFFLRRGTFFQRNRIYLLISLLLAFTLPLAEYGGFDDTVMFSNQLPTLDLDGSVFELRASESEASARASVRVLYIGGCGLAGLLVLLQAFGTIYALRRARPGQAFSFFGMIRIDGSVYGSHQIARHEQVHARQWHSADIMVMQVIKIFNWFNPMVYLYERALRLQHEYIADGQTAAGDQLAYAELLVSHAMGVSGPVLGNSFSNGNLLKRRITMLLRDKSPRVHSWRYVLLLPLVAGMLAISLACNHDNASGVEGLDTPRQLAAAGEMPEADANNRLFQSVEVEPKPPGGMRAFMEYIGRNYDFPQEAIEAGVNGQVQVSFVVERDGSLTDLELVRDLGYGTGEAAIRVLQSSSKWTPGIQNGRTVRVAYTLPIRLNLQQ